MTFEPIWDDLAKDGRSGSLKILGQRNGYWPTCPHLWAVKRVMDLIRYRAFLPFRTGLFVLLMLLLTPSFYAQEVEVEGMPDEERPASYPLISGRDAIQPQRSWTWEELGPTARPPELAPGGSAIPSYAENRGNGTGRINFIYVHPRKKGRVWACSPTGGIWFTRDNGLHWKTGGTDALPISGMSSITVNSRNINQWIAATGDGDDVFMFSDGVWRTRNSGKTWENINGDDPATALPFGKPDDFGSYISMVATMPGHFNYLVVASSQGLWVSENANDATGKIRWKRVAQGHFFDVLFIPAKKGYTILASGDKVVMSDDSGESWKVMPTPEYPEKDKYPFLRINLEWSASTPTIVHAAVTCSEALTMSALGEGTYQQFDLRKKTWKTICSLKKGLNNVITTRARAFAIHPKDALHILIGNIQPVYYSLDGGIEFSKIEKNQMHDDIHQLVFSPDGSDTWAAHDGGVSYSRDGGLHWEPRDNGIGAANVFGLATAQTPRPQVLYGGYDTGGNLLLDGAWSHTNWGDGLECVIHPEHPEIMFSTGQSGSIFKSIDGKGFNATVGSRGTTTEWHTWIRLHPADARTLYCSGSSLVRSNDLGENWEPILQAKKLGDHLYTVYKFFLTAEHPNVMYAHLLDKTKEHPELWRSFNVTESDPSKIEWERVPDPPGMTWTSGVAIDPDDPRNFWILFSSPETSGKIFYCDHGQYTDLTGNMGHSRVESLVLQRGSEHRLYAGSNYGIFTRARGDLGWTLLTGLPGTYIKTLDINYVSRHLVVGTFGRGVWQGPLLEH